ncbi:hypothetical protein MBRU_10695 [Mycolicibacterium brumae DSM 44177]|nr:hypothetical protein MBRU_10695 [Mycolicibacterium brumae DSM 44177]
MPAIAEAVNNAIAAPRLPGAVVQIGHGGEVVYRQAFGVRKLAGEPGLDGKPSAAEPMTLDTIFDIASLTKIFATATAVMQLQERGLVQVDDPVQTYLPEFNPDDDPERSAVTLRMLLTHTSGLGGDLSHQGPWGLTAADRADGLARALATPLEPGRAGTFHYSDTGFILLGELVERVSGEPLDEYARTHVFEPLRMTDTRFLPPAKACGPRRILGNAVSFDPDATEVPECAGDSWDINLLARIAPTSLDEEGPPELNPDYGHLIRGTVHDPTARRMGGAVGSAGVFSTVTDLGRYAQALLDRLAGRPSAFPLRRDTLESMTTPQQPDPDNLRGFGWDIDTPHSGPRGRIFPVGSFGHTGFTGVTVWIDPGSDSYVIVLGNVIHQRGGPPIVRLSGEIATLAGQALHLYGN